MNRRLRTLIKYIIPAVLLLFVFLCSRIPALAEAYIYYIYPPVATALSFVTHGIPFSLMDVLIVAAIILLVWSIVLMCRRRLRVLRWARLLILSLLWGIVWFYMAWGIAYFRPGFYARFQMDEPKEDSEFFEAMTVRYIDALNRAYRDVAVWDKDEIDREIEKMYAKRHRQLRLPYPCGWRRTKFTLTDPLMTRMGVAGYFGPFFNEVHVNNYALPISYPFTLAHEKAHQLGIAGEAECNLFAAVVCTSSEHPLVRYSGYAQTVSYLLGNVRRLSPEKYREMFELLDPRVVADYRQSQEHWQKASSPTLSAVQDRVYDSYLKTNKQQDGIRSYSGMVALLVAWEKRLPAGY